MIEFQRLDMIWLSILALTFLGAADTVSMCCLAMSKRQRVEWFRRRINLCVAIFLGPLIIVGRKRMRSRIGILFCSLALLQILGSHWAFLQTGAWIGMVVQYSQQVGLKAGLAQTFDGEHPCSVCKAIQDGKKHEQKKAPLLHAELKKDYLADWNSFQFHQGWIEMNHPESVEQLQGLAMEPAVPPPRS